MFSIFVRTVEGETFQAFTFRGTETAGIARARSEAKRFGYDLSDVWAVAI